MQRTETIDELAFEFWRYLAEHRPADADASAELLADLILPKLGSYFVNEVTATIVSKFVAGLLEDGVTPERAQRVLKVMTGLLTFGGISLGCESCGSGAFGLDDTGSPACARCGWRIKPRPIACA